MSVSTIASRLAALRAELATQNLAGFVVPLTDEHMSEYVGSYAKRLEWLTGFDPRFEEAVLVVTPGAALLIAMLGVIVLSKKHATEEPAK